MKNYSLSALLFALVLGFGLSSCATQQNIVQTAAETESLSTLVTAVQAAGLAETLSDEDATFTVFAPTNDAFAALPAGTLDALLKAENKAQLQAVLKYHVISGNVLSTDLTNGMEAATVQGEKVMVDLSNGVMINGANVVTADIATSNGTVHIIDQVLLPPSMTQQPEEGKNIVELAVATEALSTLVAAVKAGGLVDVLSGDGPFTVFAPTNEAFAALPAGLLEDLLKPENKDQLVKILTYHVVPAKVMSTDLSNGQTAATVQGENVTVDLSNGVKISGATVVGADVEASNGVVHVIDQVILPPSMR